MSDDLDHVRQWFLSRIDNNVDAAAVLVHSADSVPVAEFDGLLKANPGFDPDQIYAGCWAVHGGLDKAVLKNGFADEQSLGFEIERLSRFYFRNAAPFVVAFSPASVWNCEDVSEQVRRWLDHAGISDVKESTLKDGRLLYYGTTFDRYQVRQQQRIVLGLVLSQRKLATFATPVFYEAAERECVTVVVPSEEGRTAIVDVVLKKTSDDTLPRHWWISQVVDDPDRVGLLSDRNTVDELCRKALQRLNDAHLPRVFHIGDPEITFPLVAKPDDANSHKGLWFVPNKESLDRLVARASASDTWILQQCVLHSGVVFKVSVAGENVFLARRLSAVSGDGTNLVELTRRGDIHPRKAKYKQQENAQETVLGLPDVGEEYPSMDAIKSLARVLREQFQLSFFGFDVIVERSTRRLFLVDVNYFPSFVDVPNRETLVLRHMRRVVEQRRALVQREVARMLVERLS